MRFKITAPVDGNLLLDQPYLLKRDDLEFEFLIDKERRLSEIAVSKDILQKDIYRYKSTISKADGVVHLSVGGDPFVKGQIMTSLRFLESNLSFASGGALRKIHWESGKEEFIPENEEEKGIIAVSSLRTTKEYKERRTRLSTAVLAHYAVDGERYAELVIPKAFWREGLTNFSNFQYIQAFYNYYFVIEGLYANGKTGEKEVLKEFAKSKEFADISEKTLKTFFNVRRHWRRLLQMLKEEDYAVNKEGLQKLLFKVRGNVHHYSNRSKKTTATPFNQDGFETIALICGHIACMAIGYREVKINNKMTA